MKSDVRVYNKIVWKVLFFTGEFIISAFKDIIPKAFQHKFIFKYIVLNNNLY